MTVPRDRGSRDSGILRSATKLFSGSGIGAIAKALAALILARHLGARNYGQVALVQGYWHFLHAIAAFNSFHLLVGYWHTNTAARRLQFLKLAYLLDGAGVVLATALALLLLPAALSLGFVDFAQPAVVVAWSLATLTNLRGVPDGLWRIRKWFGVAGLYKSVAGVLVLATAAAAAVFDLDAVAVVIALAVAELIGNLTQVLLGWRARPEGLRLHVLFAARHAEAWHSEGVVRYVRSTFLNGSVRAFSRDGDVLVAGWVAGPVGAGFLKIAKQVGALVNKILDPFYQVIFPELAETYAEEPHRLPGETSRFNRRYGWPAAGLIMFTGIASIWGVPLVLDSSFQGAGIVVALQLGGLAVTAATFALHPAFMASQRAHVSLRWMTVAVGIQFAILVAFGSPTSLWVLGIAYAGYATTFAAGLRWELSRYKREQPVVVHDREGA